MTPRVYILMAYPALALTAAAQVQSDHPIVLEGLSPETRQVIGLDASIAPHAALNASVERSGTYRFALPEAGAVWVVDLEGTDSGPVAGTHLLVRAPEGALGSPALLFNGTGPYPVVLPGGAPLDTTLTAAGTLLSLVFDGTGFQVMNGPAHVRRPCPEDMVAVNESYCIDRFETAPPLNFFDAALACGAQGKRMCAWGEFHAACEARQQLGLTDMVDNWEWTNSTADSNLNVRTVGGGDCQVNQRVNAQTNTRRFHCCLTR
jgi:hypothetical protein